MRLPFTPIALKNLISKPSTVNYPTVEIPAMPNYRGRIAYDAEKCVNCGMCIKVCSPGAIERTIEDVPGGQKITYHIDMTSCTFCATCQDFCNTGAMHLTEDFHIAAQDTNDLIVTGTRIKKTVKGKLAPTDDCVFCGLCAKNCPEGAITVDRETKTWTLNEEECAKCGTCVQKCPKKCLDFRTDGAAAEEGVSCNSDECVFCGLCAKTCPQEAITVDRATKTWSVNKEICVKCGACVAKCPKKALTLND